MKRTLQSVLAILLIAMLSCTIVACNKAETPKEDDSKELTVDSVIGTWELTSIIDTDGTTYTLDEYCAAKGVDAGGVKAIYDFKADGILIASIGGIEANCTYTFDNGKIIFTPEASGQSSECTYVAESDTIEASAQGMKSILTKK